MSSLDNLRKAAKRWLKALRAGDVAAHARWRRAYPNAPTAPGLRDVQRALALERGFASWTALKSKAIAEERAKAISIARRSTHLASRGSGRRRRRALSFRGYVDRLRQILRDDPSLVKVTSEDGITPLWWLPDDDAKALEIVELLVSHGANPAARSKNGSTAADWARKRGMLEVAHRLTA